MTTWEAEAYSGVQDISDSSARQSAREETATGRWFAVVVAGKTVPSVPVADFPVPLPAPEAPPPDWMVPEDWAPVVPWAEDDDEGVPVAELVCASLTESALTPVGAAEVTVTSPEPSFTSPEGVEGII